MNPDDIRAWTAANEEARAAYRADRLAAAGICVHCETNKRDGRHRRCWTCRHRRNQ